MPPRKPLSPLISRSSPPTPTAQGLASAAHVPDHTHCPVLTQAPTAAHPPEHAVLVAAHDSVPATAPNTTHLPAHVPPCITPAQGLASDVQAPAHAPAKPPMLLMLPLASCMRA
ncbi:hypothetical protein LIER_27322 [Lithospermum erythrorhizon]|uniref:Uncharacterized protein n=1 Tax=Lithospermum erythrorhizon TaxID=34254 RepID=A0AAV3RBL5_LITER